MKANNVLKQPKKLIRKLVTELINKSTGEIDLDKLTQQVIDDSRVNWPDINEMMESIISSEVEQVAKNQSTHVAFKNDALNRQEQLFDDEYMEHGIKIDNTFIKNKYARLTHLTIHKERVDENVQKVMIAKQQNDVRYEMNVEAFNADESNETQEQAIRWMRLNGKL